MTRRRLALITVLCAGAAAGAAPRAGAQSRNVTIERRGPLVLTIEPGGHATLVFRVTNRASAPRAVAGFLTLPPAWRLIVPDGAMTVAAHESELKLLQVVLPRNATADRYVLRYVLAVGGAAANEPRATDSVLVEVPRRRRITASAVDVPRFVVAGASYHTRFLVRNEGNAPADVLLRATAGERYPVLLDSGPAVLHLAPGGERVVRATVTTDPDLTRRLSHRVQLDASVPGDSSVQVASVSTVEIIARKLASPSRFRTVPALLAIRRGDYDQNLSFELLGGGMLTPDGATRVSFLARGPRPRASLFAEQDEYWLQLVAPRYALRVGDQEYRSSRISNAGFSTFGASADVALGALRVGGYGERDRRAYTYTQGQQYGGSLDLRLAPGDSIGVGYFTRQGQGAGNVVSGRGAFSPILGTAFTGEYGKGVGGANGAAYVASLVGQEPGLTYHLWRQWADTGFAGNWRGTSYTSGQLTLRPPGPIDLVGSFDDFATEQIASIPYSRAARLQNADGGFNLFDGTLGAFYRHARQLNSFFFTVSNVERHSESARLTLGIPYLRRVTLRGELEHGYTIDDLTPDDRKPFRRWAVRGGTMAFGQSISASVERLQGTPVYAPFPLDQLTGSVNARIRVTNATTLSVGWSGSRYGALPFRTYSMFDIGIGQQLPFGQRVGYRSRSYAIGAEQAPLFRQSMQQAEYVMPIGVPVGATEGSGTVQVSLVDDRTGRGMPDVLMRLGDQARITDGYGRAQFVGLTAQTYYLEVDREKLGRGRVIAPVTPVPIALRTDETRQVDLRVVGSAAVRGGVRALRAQPRRLGMPDTLVDAGPLTGTALQMASGGDTVRTIVDRQGRFVFGDLHPGRWVLTVVEADLPPRARLEPARVDLDLHSGDAREVELRAVPVAVPVKFIAEADLTPGAKPRVVEKPALPSAPPPPTPTPVARSNRYYIVARGDTSLAGIARIVYGDSTLWPKLWVANHALLPTLRALAPGQRLLLPDPAPLSRLEARLRPSDRLSAPVPAPAHPRPDWRPPVVRHHYTVERGDGGLMAIARVMYGDATLWPKLWIANLDKLGDPDRVPARVRLRVPEKGPLTAEERAARDAYEAGRAP